VSGAGADEKVQLFVLAEPKEFWWPVKIPVPTDGDFTFARLDVLFALLPQPEVDRMLGRGLLEGERAPDDEAIARRVLRGWRKLLNEHGQAVEYSEAAREKLLAAPLVRTSIVATFLAVATGAAARKNG
jgi:hypothetical protein